MREFKKNLIPRPSLAPPEWLMSPVVPKELEIGAGDGEFALHKAQSQPDTHFIAIEKSRNLFRRMENKCQKQKLSNLWIFHTNAVWWITHFVLKNSLNRIYILYPNTYIKERQKNLRWCNRPFMPYLLDRLKAGGTLKICTNQQNYYEETKQKMALYPDVEQTQDIVLNPANSGHPPTRWHSGNNNNLFTACHETSTGRTQSHPLSPPTAFERKYRARGETSWSLVYEKLFNTS